MRRDMMSQSYTTQLEQLWQVGTVSVPKITPVP
jgi:hypothetical protein